MPDLAGSPAPTGAPPMAPAPGPVSSLDAALAEAIDRLDDAGAIARAATAVLRSALGVDRCAWAVVEPGAGHLSLRAQAAAPGLAPLPEALPLADIGPAALRAVTQGEVHVASGGPTPGAAGYASVLLQPVSMPSTGAPEPPAVACMAVLHGRDRPWSDPERAAVAAVAQRCAGAIGRVQVAQALAANEARLSAMLDALPVGVILADAQGRLLRDNQAHRALWGGPPMSQGWTEYGEWVGFRPDTGERIPADGWAMSRALLHGEVVRGELVECQPFGGGPRRFYLNNAAPVRDATGRIVGGVVAELDVTEARAVEIERERLLESERRARERVEQLQALTAELSAAATPQAVARATVAAGGRVIGAVQGSVYRITGDASPHDTFELVAALGYDDAFLTRWQRVPRAFDTPAATAVERGEPVLVGGPDELLGRWPGLRDLVATSAYQGTAVFPLRLPGARGAGPQGDVIGFVGFDFDRPRTLADAEVQFLGALADLCAQALDRARLAQAEHESRMRLEGILGAISDGFFALDTEWRFIYVNPHAERILGVEPGALLGRVLWDEFAPARGTVWESEYRRSLATGRPTTFEAEYAPLGAWFEVRAHPGPQGLSVYFRDVTAQHEAARRLARSESRLQAIFDHAPVGLVFAEAPSGRVVAGNRRAVEIIGHEVMKAEGIEAYAAYGGQHPDGRPYAAEEYPLARVLRGEDRVDEELLYRRGDGRHAWVRLSAVALRDEDGQVSGAMVALMDIDRERRALSSLARRGEELEQTQVRLELALDAGRMGVWDWSPVTGDAVWSPQMFALLGLPPVDDGASSGDAFTERVHAEDRPVLDAAIARALADSGHFEAEMRVRRADGELRWVLGRGQVLRDGQGHVLRMVGVNLDITERKTAEQALLDADRRRNEFLAMLGHELRNPLAPIANAVRLLERDDTQLEHRSAAVRIVKRQAGHLARLVDDLLEVSRVTQGRIDLRTENLLVAGPLFAAVESVRPLVREQQQVLTVDVPGDLDVVADPARLTQIVANLLNNAAKYTSRGGHITLQARADGSSVVITVSDDGVGIDAALLPRVFDLFTQAETTLDRSRGGLGLGLALVRRLTELHGGTVTAFSPGPGHGSTFTVRLPREERRHGVRGVAAGLPGRRVSPMPILVVDDNVDAAESLATLLEADGHRVRIAHDGEVALDAARRVRPRVVLLDIGLPRMDGFAVARALRSDPATSHATIVALSGYGEAVTRARGEVGAFDAQLLKPAALDDIYRAIERGRAA